MKVNVRDFGMRITYEFIFLSPFIMPPKRTGRRHYPGKKAATAKRGRQTRRTRSRTSAARPMRALSNNYRALNVYRFFRETLPQTVTFNLIPQGAGSYPAMGYMNFDNLQMNQLPGIVDDMAKLFARYKVDKIVTKLTPLWEEQVVQQGIVAGAGLTDGPQLEITRVNTKYMIVDFPIATSAQDQLTELAQLQSKSVSKYSRRKPLTLITMNPGTTASTVVDAGGSEVESRGASPWLSWGTTNVPLKHNSIIFGRRIDGGPLTNEWKYSVTHQIFFRCSQVG